jgi:hypothetical protein
MPIPASLTVTYTQFQADFPEFANATTYPESSFNFWYNVIGLSINDIRWGELINYGAELFIAHNLALSQQGQIDAALGNAPGTQVNGVLQTASVDKLRAVFSTQETAIENGGTYNLTTYGKRFLELSRMIGAGPLEIAPLSAGMGDDQTAWYGPVPQTPGFTGFY